MALVVVLTWPYFRVTDLLAAARDFDAIHRVLYVDPPARYGFAFAVGLPALAVRLRRTASTRWRCSSVWPGSRCWSAG